jgi:sRNA-binding protein
MTNQDDKKEQRQRVLYDWLFVDYPSVFNSKNPVPLTKGIADTLLEQLPENVTKADLKSVLGWYCRRMNYLQALIKHPHRVNLNNEPVEAITDEEKTAAQQQLERYDEIRKREVN